MADDQAAVLTVASALHVDQYSGQVQHRFSETSFMRKYTNVRSIRHGATSFDQRIGKTVLKTLVAGVTPAADIVKFGKVSVTVDTVILAREIQGTLDQFQETLAVRMEVGTDHGIEIGSFYDEAHMIMAIKGCIASAPLDTAGAALAGFNGGHINLMAANGDEADADKFQGKIEEMVDAKRELEIDLTGAVLFVRPTEYTTLANSNKLIDEDLSPGNGSTAAVRIKTCAGIRIQRTARIVKAAISSHRLGSAYDMTLSEASCIALLITPKSLMTGSTIEIQSKVWWDDRDKIWYIDSWLAFGVNFNRAETCGGVWLKSKRGTTDALVGITDNV